MENGTSNGKMVVQTVSTNSTSNFHLQKSEKGLFEFFHLSRTIDYDFVFEPRIPGCHAPNENMTIPRISVAPNIECCLRGICLPPWEDKLFAHRFEVDEDFIKKHMKLPEELVNLVPDSFVTFESWILKEIKSEFIGTVIPKGYDTVTFQTPSDYKFHDIFPTTNLKVNCKYEFIPKGEKVEKCQKINLSLL